MVNIKKKINIRLELYGKDEYSLIETSKEAHSLELIYLTLDKVSTTSLPIRGPGSAGQGPPTLPGLSISKKKFGQCVLYESCNRASLSDVSHCR